MTLFQTNNPKAIIQPHHGIVPNDLHTVNCVGELVVSEVQVLRPVLLWFGLFLLVVLQIYGLIVDVDSLFVQFLLLQCILHMYAVDLNLLLV